MKQMKSSFSQSGLDRGVVLIVEIEFHAPRPRCIVTEHLRLNFFQTPTTHARNRSRPLSAAA